METLLSRKYSKHVECGDLYSAILQLTNSEVARFVAGNIGLNHKNTVLFFPSKGNYQQEYDLENIQAIVDLRKTNLSQDFNRLFVSINKLLPDAGMYIGCFESYYNRRLKIINKLGKQLGKYVWIVDFLINRVLPKWNVTAILYQLITGNHFKVSSLAETLGRLVYCGFEIVGYIYIDTLTYFVVMKTCEPKDDKSPSYKPLFKMRRIGKNGEIIKVYKIRTMHPYSEFIQDYVVRMNGYNEIGKPNKDFRVTGWGRIIRKVWIDEIPQFVNLLKGELNIIGVRPLSKFGFEALPPDLQKERIKYKPGIIPPNVSLKLKGFDGVIKAERIYLREMKDHPLRTNTKYFFMAIKNILLHRAKSS